MVLISVFGINYKFTALKNLECLAFTLEDITKSLPLLISGKGIQQGVIISTCNRTEVYTVYQEGFPLQQVLRNFIRTVKPACTDEMLDNFYYKEGSTAIEHLFSVASGLDSLVIGENEIAGQVKEAFRIACGLKTTGTLTNKLFHAAFRTSKRVKNETKINEGNCSIGCVAIDLAEQMFPKIQTCQIVLIGAGEIMQVVAKNLKARDVDNMCIANRNFTKAIQLTEKVGGTAIPFHKVKEQFGRADIIISGTGSSAYLFRYDDMKEVLRRRWDNPMLIIDIALPRDFDTKIGELPNVTLKNLYDLQEVVDLNLRKREQEIPKAEKIIAEEVRKFRSWKEALHIKPTIQALTENFERIRIAELEKQRKHFLDETFSQLDHYTKSLTNKYIHHIISNLKLLHKVCSLTPEQVHIIEQLFGCYEDIDEHPHCGFKRQQSCVETDTNGD